MARRERLFFYRFCLLLSLFVSLLLLLFLLVGLEMGHHTVDVILLLGVREISIEIRPDLKVDRLTLDVSDLPDRTDIL